MSKHDSLIANMLRDLINEHPGYQASLVWDHAKTNLSISKFNILVVDGAEYEVSVRCLKKPEDA